jgi:hypothetical protein
MLAEIGALMSGAGSLPPAVMQAAMAALGDAPELAVFLPATRSAVAVAEVSVEEQPALIDRSPSSTADVPLPPPSETSEPDAGVGSASPPPPPPMSPLPTVVDRSHTSESVPTPPPSVFRFTTPLSPMPAFVGTPQASEVVFSPPASSGADSPPVVGFVFGGMLSRISVVFLMITFV